MKSRFFAVLMLSVTLLSAVALSVRARDVSKADLPSTVDFQASYVPGEVLVKLRAGVTISAQPDRTLAANRATLSVSLIYVGARHIAPVFASNASLDLKRVYRVQISGEVMAAVKELSADPNVEYAEPNYLVQAAIMPNDPLYASQWALDKINAPAAWNVVTGTPGMVIALIDSGIDTTHPDLAGKLWINPGEIPGNVGQTHLNSGQVRGTGRIMAGNHAGRNCHEHAGLADTGAAL